MQIGHITIDRNSRPLVVAELSGNHNGSLDRALALVDAVAGTGAQAVKLQTYTADTMTLDIAEGEFFISDPGSPWKGQSLYALYRKAHTPWEWHAPIFSRAREHGLLAFSAPFDSTAVDLLESLAAPAYKIASFENTDLPLIRRVAATGKPIIISTGMATLAEIDEAVQTARAAGCKQLALLKCTSNYPASPASSNLMTIPLLRELFDCEVGVSDHTLGIGTALGSVALGGSIIEKHVTLKRADGGVDAAFSAEPAELKQLVSEADAVRSAVGTVHIGPADEERPSMAFRRSLYVCADLRPGDVLTPENLRAIRPGFGLPPKFASELLGQRVTRPVRRGTPASWDLVTNGPPKAGS